MEKKDLFGYLIGLVVFVIAIPAFMYKISGPVSPGRLQTVCFAVLAVPGIGLSIWSIVSMRIVGKGNPMDAFDHEIAPRTTVLMKEGPYRLCRNPMLLGIFIYYAGLLLLLCAWKALAVFVVFAVIMMRQVASEEKRLERDFGEAYLEYKQSTKKLIPFFW